VIDTQVVRQFDDDDDVVVVDETELSRITILLGLGTGRVRNYTRTPVTHLTTLYADVCVLRCGVYKHGSQSASCR